MTDAAPETEPHPHEVPPTLPPSPSAGPETPSGAKMAVEYGPVLVFVILYNYLNRTGAEDAIYTAAGVFAVVAVLSLVWWRLKAGSWPKMLLFSTAIVVGTVGLAWGFEDPRFFYMKPTVVNIAFGLGVLGGLVFGKNVIRLVMGGAYSLPDPVWTKLAVRWGLFFFAMAALNEVVWRTQTESFWANFKLFGFLPITLVFAASQAPLILRHQRTAD